MARPKRNAPGPDAQQRMISAFWEMLARMPFDEITIGGISRVANVSPNTLYYHFDGLLDIAREAVESELSEEVAMKMLGNATGDGLPLLVSADSRDGLRLSRIGLAASSGSARLTAMLVDMLKRAWCSLASRTLESLTEEESMDLDFVYGGLISVLADRSIREDPKKLAAFLGRPLGRGIATTMANLSAFCESRENA